jgi:hypothetical protein
MIVEIAKQTDAASTPAAKVSGGASMRAFRRCANRLALLMIVTAFLTAAGNAGMPSCDPQLFAEPPVC